MFSITYNCDYLLSSFLSLKSFVLISFVALFLFSLYFSFFYPKKCDGKSFKRENIGVIMVVLGGSLNLLEWFDKECVKDYINFFNLFKFNFYDVLVTLGVILVAISICKKK